MLGRQQGVHIGGDFNLDAAQNGSNILNSAQHISQYINSPSNINSRLQILLKNHEDKKEKDRGYKEFTEELNRFFAKKISDNPRTLKQKLSDGNRDSFNEIALELKDDVMQKITELSYYQSAQDIFTYLLANIKTTFQHEIHSRIVSGRFEVFEINDELKDRIITPLYQQVCISSIGLDESHIYGLLYLLTGNCHIDWD